jgi:hypothetical protein
MVLLIIFIMYVLPAVAGFVIYYVHWCKNDEEGYTIEDMKLWMMKHTTISNVFNAFIPIINWAILTFAISDVFGDKFMNLRIRRNAKPTKTKRH